MWYTLGSTFRLIYTITCVMSLFACADNSDELKIEVLVSIKNTTCTTTSYEVVDTGVWPTLGEGGAKSHKK